MVRLPLEFARLFRVKQGVRKQTVGYSRGEANTAQPLRGLDRGDQSLWLLGFEVRARDSGAYGQKAHYREDG